MIIFTISRLPFDSLVPQLCVMTRHHYSLFQSFLNLEHVCTSWASLEKINGHCISPYPQLPKKSKGSIIFHILFLGRNLTCLKSQLFKHCNRSKFSGSLHVYFCNIHEFSIKAGHLCESLKTYKVLKG